MKSNWQQPKLIHAENKGTTPSMKAPPRLSQAHRAQKPTAPGGAATGPAVPGQRRRTRDLHAPIESPQQRQGTEPTFLQDRSKKQRAGGTLPVKVAQNRRGFDTRLRAAAEKRPS